MKKHEEWPNISEWNIRYGYGKDEDILFVKRLREEAGLNYTDIDEVLTIIDNICNHCWNGPPQCRCWDDS